VKSDDFVPPMIIAARAAIVDAMNRVGAAAGLSALTWLVMAEEGIYIQGFPAFPESAMEVAQWARLISAEPVTPAFPDVHPEWRLAWDGWTIELFSEAAA
jgi:hypothetical protein